MAVTPSTEAQKKSNNLTNTLTGASMSVQISRSAGFHNSLQEGAHNPRRKGSGFFMSERCGVPSGTPFAFLRFVNLQLLRHLFHKGSLSVIKGGRLMSAPKPPYDRSNVLPFPAFTLPTDSQEMFTSCLRYEPHRETYALYEQRLRLVRVSMEVTLEKKYRQKYPGGVK